METLAARAGIDRLREVRFPSCSHPRGSPLTDAPRSAGLVALADRIELWPIDRLRPYERNPRTHSEAQLDQIAASMVEFGWTNPVAGGGGLQPHPLLTVSGLGDC